MSRILLLSWLVGLVLLTCNVRAWDTEDHEIFDLVSALESAEGKGVTFYKFLNISKSATLNEINKASRKLSLAIHPDKHPGNKSIEEKFARLGLITAILRDEDKRKRYNFFHDNGVPRWKGTGYMYSRWQPGLGFALSFVLGVATLMQYAAQHVNYRSEIQRIKRFQTAARQAAYRKPDKSGAGSKPLERKKVKISIGKSLGTDQEDGGPESDTPVPKSRQERRRMQHITGSSKSGGNKSTQPGWIDMVVEGDNVWIVTEDGSELPLVESAASEPAITRTFIPALFLRLFGTFLPKSIQASSTTEVQNSREEADGDKNTGTSTGASKGPQTSPLKNRKAAKVKN